MNIHVLRKEFQTVGAWTGGTTTQLAIWPEEADYASRRFDWRVSSASVEQEKSDFTSLPGFHRILMILEGKIHLKHEGIRELTLNEFEQECFDGSWKTTSQGKCVDFNLMTAKGYSGSVTALRNEKEPLSREMFIPDTETFDAIYCLADLTAKVESGELSRMEALKKGDFLLIQRLTCPAIVTLEAVQAPLGSVFGIHVKILKDNLRN